jgi:hypothetical protein
MRAALLRQHELRDELRPALNNGHKGWNDDEPAVVQAAGEIILRQYFGAGYDVRAVTDFVSELREAANNNGQLPRLKTEAVIRGALGETDVDTSGISSSEKLNVYFLSTVLARGKLKISDRDVDELIAEAERVAFGRGWHPPLAD